jgi:probable HAF family extracellular repeat protein
MSAKAFTVVSVFLCSAVAFAGDSFHGLGGVSDGGFLSAANGVSRDGRVVVGIRGADTGLEAVRWTPTGAFPLGDLPGGGSFAVANDVSFSGRFVVGQSDGANGFEAYRWSGAATGMVGLGDLPGPGPFASRALAISGNGLVVVGLSQRPQNFHGYNAWRWTAGTGMVDLGDLPGGDQHGIASDVCADGSVVVGSSSSAEGNEGFIWTPATGMLGIGDLPGGFFGSSAEGVSADGIVVVGYGTGPAGSEAIRWTQSGGMVGLGDLPGGNFSSAATAASAHGDVIVGSGSTADSFEAFFWTPALGMVALKQFLLDHGVQEVEGWRLVFANDISADGRTIVGNGINPNFEDEAWVATIDLGDDLDEIQKQK